MLPETNNATLSFVETGKGKITLVFLHYFGGSYKTWAKVIKELSNDYRCIAIDLPGFGDSEITSATLSVKENAKIVANLIRAFHLKKFVLIGHSMGGKIAAALASLRLFGLEKLILIAPSPPTPEPMDEYMKKELLIAYNKLGELRMIINKITYKPLADEEINSLIKDNMRASHTAWNGWIEEGSQEDISMQMKKISIPVLVISGEYDKNLSSNFLHDKFVKYFPLADFKEVKGTGHLIPVEDSLAVAKLIQDAI